MSPLTDDFDQYDFDITTTATTTTSTTIITITTTTNTMVDRAMPYHYDYHDTFDTYEHSSERTPL